MRNNIIKYILIFVIGSLVLSSSCENIESNYDLMTKDYDKNGTTFYIQYLNASQYFETAIDEAGLPEDIVTTVGVKLLGPPQSSDISVQLILDGSSTIPSDAYELSSSSIVIPAGGTSGTVSLTVLADKMTEDETVTLVMNMDAGGAEAASASQLNYDLKRIKFCPLNDLNTMAGNWSGVDDWGNEEKMTTSVDGENLMMIDLGKVWLNDVWGEPTSAMNPVVVTMNPNGTLVIEEQAYCSTTYEGLPYEYAIVGEGSWDNCKHTMHIEYDMHNTTDGYYLSDYGYAPIIIDLIMK